MTAPSVIVSGMIAATPHQGGASWAVLQYLLGLRRLGCEVHFVEPVTHARLQDSPSARYCASVMRRFGLDGRWALLRPDHPDIVGMSRAHLRAVARDADILINVSGMLTDADVLDRIDARVYLDLDPGFVQLWQAVDGIDMRFEAHTHFVTIADAIGEPSCPIPACGRDWIPTLPPVVLDEWPVAGDAHCGALTTVGHWRGYGSVEHEGRQYGQKAHSLRPLVDLPTRTVADFHLALAIHDGDAKDITALREHGWTLVDPDTIASTPDDYRRFVQASWGEFGIAKSGYVVSRAGWFSDRSACYLASGRPVIAQDTGFDRRLPTGEGLFAFAGDEDVLAAVDALRRDYARHRAAARAIAEEVLDSDRVLTSLLDRITT